MSIIPAKDYVLAGSTALLDNWKLHSYLFVEENSMHVDSLLVEKMNPELLALREASLTSKSSGPTIDGTLSTRLLIEQTRGILVKKTQYTQLFILGDSLQSLLIGITYPDTLSDAFRDELLAMVSTVQWDRGKALDPMELLRFSVQPIASYTRAGCENGRVDFFPEEVIPDSSERIPIYCVQAIQSYDTPLNEKTKKEEVDRILRFLTYSLPTPSIIELNEITLDGITGYETISTSSGYDGLRQLTLYATILFHPEANIALYGYSWGQNLDQNIQNFKAMTRTFKRKKVGQLTDSECERLLAASLYKEARDCYRNILMVQPNLVAATLGSANASQLLGNHKEAIAEYDRVLSEEPNDESALFGRGRSKVATEFYREAIRDFDLVLKLNENNTDALIERAAAKAKYGNLPGAKADYRSAIKLFPNSRDLLVKLADVCFLAPDYNEAIEALDMALRLDSRDTYILNRRGDAYWETEKFVDAFQNYGRSLELNSNQRDIQFKYARALVAFGQFEKGIQLLDKIISTNAKDANALALRGRANLCSGKTHQALEDYADVLKLDETIPSANLERGIFRMISGDYKAAADDIRMVVKRSIFSPAHRVLLYAAEVRAYKGSVAKEHLERYRMQARQNKNYVLTTEDLAVDRAIGLITEEEFFERSEKNIAENLKRNWSQDFVVNAYFALGMVHFVTGERSVAKRYWQKAKELPLPDSSIGQLLRTIVTTALEK